MSFQPTVVPKAVRPVFAALRRFFTGAGLPAFLLAGLVVYEVFLLAVIFAPPGTGPWNRFSEEFKVWCFSYDPVAGGMESGIAWIMAAEPLLLGGIVVWLFRDNLAFWRRPGSLATLSAPLAAGAAFSAAVLAGLVVYGQPGADAVAELRPFPGERIRTRIEPPAIDLTDHRGATVDLSAFRGRVVMITGVYATCSTTCPQILRRVKDLYEWLPPEDRERFATLTLSLDPEYDTPEYMKAIADAYSFPYPGFHYLNGDPALMAPLLTDLQFAPRRNPVTGVIDHANLFLLVDADGRVAYRFNLDPRHEPWLREALAQLLREAADQAASPPMAARPS